MLVINIYSLGDDVVITVLPCLLVDFIWVTNGFFYFIMCFSIGTLYGYYFYRFTYDISIYGCVVQFNIPNDGSIGRLYYYSGISEDFISGIGYYVEITSVLKI